MMTNNNELELIKKNILGLALSMDDAPYHGINRDSRIGVDFAIGKILKGTGITIESLLKERQENK